MYLICIKQNMEGKMEELVKQAKMGNDEAFTQLIIQMQCEMFRIAQIRLKNIDDANDAIQQTNLYAYKNLRQLKEDKYFKTWIIKILINECNKVYKKNYKILNIFDKLTKEHNSVENFKVTENIEDRIDLEGILSTFKYEDAICIVLFLIFKEIKFISLNKTDIALLFYVVIILIVFIPCKKSRRFSVSSNYYWPCNNCFKS